MPVYEYICVSCAHEFEEFARSMSAPTPGRCPSCGSESIERRLSVFAARDGGAKPASMPTGGCGRCGDPNGPCSV